MDNRGRFIVIYGPNNLGKSTQFDLLEKTWKEGGRPYTRLKYPIYSSETGMLINRALRPDENGNRLEISDEQLQFLYAENRRLYEPQLYKLLSCGDVLAEDYVGTGLAWGLTKGVYRRWLDDCNYGLLKPDLEILLDGERFSSGIEKGHRHEAAGEKIWEENRRIHQELAAEFGWEVVDANQNPEKVHEKILEIIASRW